MATGRGGLLDPRVLALVVGARATGMCLGTECSVDMKIRYSKLGRSLCLSFPILKEGHFPSSWGSHGSLGKLGIALSKGLRVLKRSGRWSYCVLQPALPSF